MSQRLLPTILIGEDHPDDVFILEHRLRAAKIDNPVAVFRTGGEIVEHLTRSLLGVSAGPAPLLLLLDVNLPQIGGFDVLKWIRGQSRLNHLPVVMCSVSDWPADIERAYALGADRYLVKYPVPEVLREVVDDIAGARAA